jgi:hypothetical protein
MIGIRDRRSASGGERRANIASSLGIARLAATQDTRIKLYEAAY